MIFGGNLIAVEKKSGGIRPIAVGYTLVALPPNVPTATSPTNLQAISVRFSWESGHLEALKQHSTPQDASSKLCRMVTWSRSSISATP